MYCQNCGAEVPEGSVFCENCGRRMSGVPVRDDSFQPAGESAPYVQAPICPPSSDVQPAPEKKKKKTALIIGICAGVPVLLLAAALVLIITAPQRKALSIVRYTFSTVISGKRLDAKKMFSFYPPEYVDGLAKKMNISKTELIKLAQTHYDNMYENPDPGLSDVKLVYVKVTGSKRVPKSEVEALSKRLGIRIDAAVTVTIEVKVKVGDRSIARDADVTMVRIGLKWYADPSAVDSSLGF